MSTFQDAIITETKLISSVKFSNGQIYLYSLFKQTYIPNTLCTYRVQRKVQRFRERARNWHVVSKASSASCPWIWLIEGQCRNHTLPQAALFTETLGHSKTECRASLQLRNCRLHRPRK